MPQTLHLGDGMDQITLFWHRLVRGSGEIVEQIVSRSEQRHINKLATFGVSAGNEYYVRVCM